MVSVLDSMFLVVYSVLSVCSELVVNVVCD